MWEYFFFGFTFNFYVSNREGLLCGGYTKCRGEKSLSFIELTFLVKVQNARNTDFEETRSMLKHNMTVAGGRGMPLHEFQK